MAAQFSVSERIPLHHRGLTAVQDGWMAVRVQQRMVKEDLHLFSKPCLSEFRHDSKSYFTVTRHPRLYFCYNAASRKTTILTNGLNGMHLRMVDHFKNLAKKPKPPEEFAFQLLFEWFSATLECFKRIAISWDTDVASSVFPVPASTLGGVTDLFTTNRSYCRELLRRDPTLRPK
jgi:hypothetical protein